MTPSATERKAVELARSCFLTKDNLYGCAETTLIVLQEIYGLPDPTDSSAAMVLNGGVAYSGRICGAICGAAMAVGKLVERRIAHHKEAKQVARQIIIRLMEEFQTEYGSLNCRDLINLDISTPAGHDEFMRSGIWRETCMNQIEFVVQQLCSLQDEQI